MMRRAVPAGCVAAALALALTACLCVAAGARAHLTGIALSAPAGGTIIVHHDPFDGMPAMTMTFSVPPGTHVRPGDHIAAAVDTSTDPWALSALVVSVSAARPDVTQIPFLRLGDRVPQTPFVDQFGRRASLATLRGRPYALTFIYTRCRDPRMCPLVSAKLHRVQGLSAGSRAALVEVSLDPAYDRPAVLARYATLFAADPARWHLYTGDPRTVLDFAARFGILERSAGPQTIIHSERLAIVDAEGRIRRFFDDATWRADDVAAALRNAST
jgi:cytochrome oxidase Cu insertion factor (SCO1/SenC/PrrC family)/Cu/Ag efflux protein CusF